MKKGKNRALIHAAVASLMGAALMAVPAAAVVAKNATTEFLANSPAAKILRKCLEITDLSRPKSLAI